MSDLPAVVWDPGILEVHRKLGNFVQYFQVNLPANGHGIPLRLVDPRIIGQHMLDCETTDDIPDSVVALSEWVVEYDDGMPLVNSLPIWERFDGELVDYYKLFKEYREMLYVSGSRAVSKLATQANLEGRNLHALSKVYHWQLRCRAYDIWKRQEAERKQQKEVELLNKKHTDAAQSMLTKGLAYLETHPEQLNPKIAVQMVEAAVKIGRLAIGLSPDKVISDVPKTSIHVTSGAGTTQEMSTTVEIGGNNMPNQQNAQDIGYLQSILHILDKSGAMDKLKVIDADFTVISDDKKVESA